MTEASIAPPTVSMAPAQRLLSNGVGDPHTAGFCQMQRELLIVQISIKQALPAIEQTAAPFAETLVTDLLEGF